MALISPVDDLEALCKEGMKAKANCKLPAKMLKVCSNRYTETLSKDCETSKFKEIFNLQLTTKLTKQTQQRMQALQN